VKLGVPGIAEKGAGDGSGASAKSAKSEESGISSTSMQRAGLTVPESPDGTGEADGFAPPKKLFNTCAISTRGDAQCQLATAGDELRYLGEREMTVEVSIALRTQA
jgi:hypothetical protein